MKSRYFNNCFPAFHHHVHPKEPCQCAVKMGDIDGKGGQALESAFKLVTYIHALQFHITCFMHIMKQAICILENTGATALHMNKQYEIYKYVCIYCCNNSMVLSGIHPDHL